MEEMIDKDIMLAAWASRAISPPLAIFCLLHGHDIILLFRADYEFYFDYEITLLMN